MVFHSLKVCSPVNWLLGSLSRKSSQELNITVPISKRADEYMIAFFMML